MTSLGLLCKGGCLEPQIVAGQVEGLEEEELRRLSLGERLE